MALKRLYGFPVEPDVFRFLEKVREERKYDPDHTVRYAVVYSVLIDLLNENGPEKHFDILVLGSGWGALEAVLPETFKSVSVDLNLDFLRYAKSISSVRAPAKRIFIRANLFDTPQLISKNFDAVLLLEVIEHLHDDQKALKVAYEMLREGGTLIVSVPNFQRLSNRIKRILGRKPSYMAPDHVREYTRDQFVGIIKSAGFGDIRVIPLSLTFPREAIFQNFISPWSPFRELMLRLFPALSTYFVGLARK